MSVELKESVELDPADVRGCDFCGCPAITAYPTPPVSLTQTATHVNGAPVAVVTRHEGDWLACAPCERLIDRKHFDRLADRAGRHADRCARVEVAGASRKVGQRFRSEAQALVRQSVAAFAAARRGEVTS